MPSQSQHPRTVTAILVGSAFLTGVDLFIVNVAFDDIGRDFASRGDTPSLSELSWVLNAYAVLFAALLVPMGRLTDRYGRKSGFVAGMAVFTLASAACASSTGVWQLVAFRGLQAVGAAAMTPASLGLLLAALPVERKAAAARLWATTGALAAAFGPAVGGGLVQLSWHWAFWINVPIGVLLVAGALRFVPDVRHNVGAPRPDLTGALVLAVAVGALVLGVVEGPEWGWTSTGVLASFATAAVGLAGFAWQTAHHASPVIDPVLLKVRAFAWANIATLVFNTGFGVSLLGGILWMQQVWDYSALRTGFAIALGPLLVPITSVVSQRLFPGTRASLFVTIGSLVSALGATVMALSVSTQPSYWTTFLPGWALMGVAVGLVMPNLLAAATSTLPPHQASTGGGIISMSRQLGLVLGVSVLVSIVSGTAAPSTEITAAWVVAAAVSVVAAVSAHAMEASRRGAPAAACAAVPTAG